MWCWYPDDLRRFYAAVRRFRLWEAQREVARPAPDRGRGHRPPLGPESVLQTTWDCVQHARHHKFLRQIRVEQIGTTLDYGNFRG